MQEKKKSTLQGVFDSVLNILTYLIGIMVVLQVVSITADVIIRFLFGFSITSIIAFNEWSMVYITFLGFAWLQREGGHVNMDILIINFSEKKRILFEIFGNILGMFVSIIMVLFGTKVFLAQVIENTYDYFKLPGFPIAIVTLAIPLGCLLLLIQLLIDTNKCLKTYKELSEKIVNDKNEITN